jgi:uncharacterized lipoprotein YbaY
MKKRSLIVASAALAVVFVGGCGHLDLTPEGNPNRVLTGAVDFGAETTLPADSVVVVRVVDPTGITETAPAQVLGMPSGAQSTAPMPPKVLGEQVIRNPGQTPVPFRIEYEAGDEQLRRGLNIEARVSYGGKLRYFNLNSYSITLNNVTDTHTVTVNQSN